MSDFDKLRTIFKELGLEEEEDEELKKWFLTEKNFVVSEVDHHGDKEIILSLFSKATDYDYLNLVTNFVFDGDGNLLSFGIVKT